MRAKIHPTYYTDTQVTCACGNVFTTGSTKKTILVDICNACHPFYTGEMRFVDTQGRVEKFQNKMKKASKYVSKKQKKQAQIQEESQEPLTLKEMIQTQRKQAKKV